MNFNKLLIILQNFLSFLVYLILKIVGIAPFSYTNNESKKPSIVKFSFFGVIYNLVFLIYMAFSHISCLFYIPEMKSKSQSAVTYFANYFSFCINLICIVLIILSITIKQKTITNTLNKLVAMERYFDKSDHNSFMELTFLGYTIGTLLAFLFHFSEDREIYPMVYLLPIYAVKVTINSYTLQYAMILRFVTRRFQFINDTLLKFKNVSNLVIPKENNLTTEFTKDNASIKNLRFLYKDLIECSENINKYYSVPILVILGKTLHSLTNCIYFVYLMISSANVEIVLQFILWVFFVIFPTWILTSAVDQILKEVRYFLLYLFKYCYNH